MSIALALGRIEEAMGLVEEGNRSAALLALAVARALLEAVAAAEAGRVPVAHYTPITEEVGQ